MREGKFLVESVVATSFWLLASGLWLRAGGGTAGSSTSPPRASLRMSGFVVIVEVRGRDALATAGGTPALRIRVDRRFLMIPSLRHQFNESFSPDKYQAFLRRVDLACGAHVQFRLSETPCVFPKALIDRMASDGQELIRQLVQHNPAYRAKSDEAVPAEFKGSQPMPGSSDVCAGRFQSGAGCAAGELVPKLVELQAFPSLYAYPGAAWRIAYIDVYSLDSRLKYLLSGLEDFFLIANFCGGRLWGRTIRRT